MVWEGLWRNRRPGGSLSDLKQVSYITVDNCLAELLVVASGFLLSEHEPVLKCCQNVLPMRAYLEFLNSSNSRSLEWVKSI